MPPSFNQFTTKAKEAIKRAHELAIERGQNHVSPMHMLAALILQEESMVTSILDKLDTDIILLTDSLLEVIESPDGSSVAAPSYQIYITPELAHIIENSVKIARNLGDEFVSTEHLFIATIDAPGQARELLTRFKIEKDSVVRVLEELKTTKEVGVKEPKKFKSILKYTRSLTKLASQNKLDPVIGRDNEISRIIQILSRRTKNNPILIGEAGVGKTAIVEGLAARMTAGNVPESLRDKELVSLDLGSSYCGNQIPRRIRRTPEKYSERN